MSKHRMNTIVVLLALFLIAVTSANAKERTWYKYENAYFEAYSDASEKKVTRLLDELENFRATIVQILNLPIPEGFTKTRVVIFNYTSEFSEYAQRNGSGGFATIIRNTPYIVMPRGGDSRIREAVVRHEFAHILLGFNGFEYPWWFNEGFAEFVSSVDFRKRNTEFRLGAPPLRAVSYSGPTMEWSELIAHSGMPDDDITLREVSNAYLQSWILVHHILLGHEFKHVPELAQYFYFTASGGAPHTAFRKAFGLTAQEMGEPLLRSKSTRVDVYTFEFNAPLRDNVFAKSDVTSGDIQSILAALRSVQQQPAD